MATRDIAEIKKLWDAGVSGAEISKKTGLSLSYLYKLRTRHGIQPRKRDADLDIQEVARAWASGEKVASIAKRMGVSESVIYKLRYKHGFEVALKNGSREPPAPTREDEIASGKSLELSPYVQHRISVMRAAWMIGTSNA